MHATAALAVLLRFHTLCHETRTLYIVPSLRIYIATVRTTAKKGDIDSKRPNETGRWVLPHDPLPPSCFTG